MSCFLLRYVNILTSMCLTSFFLCFVADGASGASANSQQQQHDYYYVSTAGNDHWSGTFPAPNSDDSDGPFATLTRARNAIRQLKSAGAFKRPCTVMVLNGTYHLAEPLVLSSRDTGNDTQPITWTCYPGHKPVLSGSRRIAGWKPYQGKILQCRLQETSNGPWKFRQLFYNGTRQIRARWPNLDREDPLYGGWAFVEAPLPKNQNGQIQFRFAPDSTPQEWARPELAEVNIFPWYCWVNDLIPVIQADLKQRTITLSRDSQFGFMPLMPGNRFAVENVLEELDQPGEWCLDRETESVYFWPPTKSVEEGSITVPVTDSLMAVRGTPQQPVRHVAISGLTFAQTSSPFPEYLHASFHSPTRRGVAVLLEHCEECRVENNRFWMLGGGAIQLDGPNRENRIEGNNIAHVGGAGIALTSQLTSQVPATSNDKALLVQEASRFPKLVRNVISNNHIHHCGVLKKNGGGVQFYGINSVNNVISHNLIHHMPDKGMTMQDGFGRFIVEYNEMYQLCQEIADTGGIMTNRWYVLKDDPDLAHGNIIRYNLIRDCIGCGAYAEQRHPKGEGDRTKAQGRIWSPYYAWGICFDNSGMDVTVYGNIITSTVLGAVFANASPRNNRVENNIFIGSSGNQFDLRMAAGAWGNRFLRNIVVATDRNAMLLSARPSVEQTVEECDYNIYFSTEGQDLRIRGIGQGRFSEWKKLGFDQHTLVADPLFVDFARSDFRLRAESPAYKLGFRPLPVDRIGLQRRDLK